MRQHLWWMFEHFLSLFRITIKKTVNVLWNIIVKWHQIKTLSICFKCFQWKNKIDNEPTSTIENEYSGVLIFLGHFRKQKFKLVFSTNINYIMHGTQSKLGFVCIQHSYYKHGKWPTGAINYPWQSRTYLFPWFYSFIEIKSTTLIFVRPEFCFKLF